MAWRHIGRLALLSGTTAVALLGVWWLSRGRLRSFMNDLFGSLYSPAMAVAIWLSPNPHDVDLVVYYAAILVQTFLMCAIAFGAFWVIRSLHASRRV